MNVVAKFEKVSFEQFKKDMIDGFSKCEEVENLIDYDSSEVLLADANLRKIYDAIKLPKRATKGSAGYDFYSPLTFNLSSGEGFKMPTGIRCKIEYNWFLSVFPRSGLGFKYRLQLDNTVGIIDADYYEAKNEGHIMIKITNDSKCDKTLTVESGSGMAQGIFMPFGITVDDDADAQRLGGLGSTNK